MYFCYNPLFWRAQGKSRHVIQNRVDSITLACMPHNFFKRVHSPNSSPTTHQITLLHHAQLICCMLRARKQVWLTVLPHLLSHTPHISLRVQLHTTMTKCVQHGLPHLLSHTPLPRCTAVATALTIALLSLLRTPILFRHHVLSKQLHTLRVVTWLQRLCIFGCASAHLQPIFTCCSCCLIHPAAGAAAAAAVPAAALLLALALCHA